jgi:hypothetical protein
MTAGRAIRLALNTTLWAAFAALVGAYYGHKTGYMRGATDVMGLVLLLREYPQPPPEWTEGRI